LLVYMAAKVFNKNGGDIDKTYDYLESIVNHITVLFVVDDLKYLARGGRISENKAKIGNIMQIKPVLTIKDGEIDVFSKQNGSKKAISFAVNELLCRYKNIDDAPIVVVNAACEDIANLLVDKVKEHLPNVEVWTQPVGPVIGAHCGPRTCGIIFTS
ncbi:MAG: DegV family protein, partial [Clostridia bacterium]